MSKIYKIHNEIRTQEIELFLQDLLDEYHLYLDIAL